MTNNPTIDGVSRELIAEAALTLRLAGGNDGLADDLRALLEWDGPYGVGGGKDAPAAERQEPEAFMYQHEETGVIGFVDVQQIEWGFEKNNPRLQVICPLYRAAPDVAALQSTIAQLQARVQELESGRGEPVGRVSYIGSGFVRVRTTECLAMDQPLFTAPPAPTTEQFREAFVSSGYVDEAQAEDLAEIATRACLDATAALNGPAQ